MYAERVAINTCAVIPLMAALPYKITGDEPDEAMGVIYDPETQLTVYAGRNFSTCREDESVGGILSKSRSDTKKDD
jgi:hypothetical protein